MIAAHRTGEVHHSYLAVVSARPRALEPAAVILMARSACGCINCTQHLGTMTVAELFLAFNQNRRLSGELAGLSLTIVEPLDPT